MDCLPKLLSFGRVSNMAASLLEGGPASVGVPVEFVQGEPEGYMPAGKATASVSVAYSASPVASATKTATRTQQLDNSVLLRHSNVMTVQSVTQQPVGMCTSSHAYRCRKRFGEREGHERVRREFNFSM